MIRRSPRANLLCFFGCFFIIMSFISGISTYQSDSHALNNIDYSCDGQFLGDNDICHANGRDYTGVEWEKYKNQEAQDRQNNAFWYALQSFGIFFGLGVLVILLGLFAYFMSTPYSRR